MNPKLFLIISTIFYTMLYESETYKDYRDQLHRIKLFFCFNCSFEPTYYIAIDNIYINAFNLDINLAIAEEQIRKVLTYKPELHILHYIKQ